MADQTFDLKQLIYLIKDNKDFDANLILDEGCTIHTEDVKPLIKVINYFINYLGQLTDRSLEISLDLQDRDYLLCLMAYSEKSELPEISNQIDEVLQSYSTSRKIVHENGKYIQVKLIFQK